MDEDIKILEKYINGKDPMKESLVVAIQNLIARYKELEEKNIKLKNHCKELLKEKQELTTIALEDVIPKSKVKEKIEELETMSISKDIYYDDIKRLFQELLEDFEETGNHIPRID